MSLSTSSTRKSVQIEKGFIYFAAQELTAQKLDAHYIKSRNLWRVPNTLGALRELYRHGYDVAELGKQKARKREELLSFKNANPLNINDKRLRPYQKSDICFLENVPHAAVFNEMRTGKTPTTLKLMELEKHDKIMVICPASLVMNWQKEVHTWTEYNALCVSGSKTKRQKVYKEWSSGFLIISKDTAKSDLDLLKTFKDYALIVDEAHFLRNYQTAQSKAIYQLGKNSSRRLALTGTPALNKPDDVYGILKFLYPEKFPSYWQFVDRYFKTWDTPWGAKEVYHSKTNPDASYKRKEELQEVLECISVQRKRSEVMKWIPKKTYQTIELKMSSKQKKAYQEMLDLFTVEEAGLDAPSVLAQLTRLRQICLAPEVLEIEAPSAKESFLMEWLHDNPTDSVIVFSNFSSYLRRLAPKIKGAKTITGDTPQAERQQIVSSFQSGKTKVILANIQAAGVGLTLDAGNTVIFLDRHFTPSLNEQAEDRIVPTTENSNQQTHIIDVICKDSIDEKIHNMLAHKVNITKAINDYRNIKEFLNEQ
jgi:SNF2 family DNA or RNA helicase